MELISVVLGVKNECSWENVYLYTQTLLEYGFSNYSIKTLIDSGDLIQTTNVINAKDNITLKLIAKESVKCTLPSNDKNLNIQSKVHLKSVIEAPTEKGDDIGYIEFFRNGILLGKSNIIAASSIEKCSKTIIIIRKVKDAWNKLFGIAIIKVIFKVILIILLVLVFFKILRLVLRKISKGKNVKKVQIRKFIK